MNDLDLAIELADLADAISQPHFFAQDFAVETKPDLTPVTECDRAVEQAIMDRLGRERPDDSVLGEEFGSHGQSPRRWIIDPIDGTKNYVRGVPVWATLISLYDGETPLIGVVSAPALGRRWWAESGKGAFASALGAPAKQIKVSEVDRLADASLSYASLSGWKELGVFDGFLELCESRCGAPADTAISTRTCCWPKVRSTLRANPSSHSTTWVRSCRSCWRPAGHSRTLREFRVRSAAMLWPATPDSMMQRSTCSVG
jgi:fructose-1,6-bisphosphatase/inositol monophosphatase family enzyme